MLWSVAAVDRNCDTGEPQNAPLVVSAVIDLITGPLLDNSR